MPEWTRVQLVLLELAAAAVAGALAAGGAWLPAGIAVGVALVALGAVPMRRRWAYQVALSWLGLRRRRRSVRVGGAAAVLGEHRVVGVAGGQGARLGVVRSGTAWTLPLEIPLDGVLNDDAPVPIDQLAALLAVEDVPLASVRLLTLLAPAVRPPSAPPGPAPQAGQFAARYCLLTVDTALAADAVAARGGAEAAVLQILRRCALRAEQVLTAAGVPVRRLDEAAVSALFATVLGPAGVAANGTVPPSSESWRDVHLAGTWSTTFAIGGAGADLPDRLARLAASAAAPLAVATLLLRPARHDEVVTTALLRLSGPGLTPDRTALARIGDYARALGLVLQRLDGEQGPLLRATAPVGVGAGPVGGARLARGVPVGAGR